MERIHVVPGEVPHQVALVAQPPPFGRVGGDVVQVGGGVKLEPVQEHGDLLAPVVHAGDQKVGQHAGAGAQPLLLLDAVAGAQPADIEAQLERPIPAGARHVGDRDVLVVDVGRPRLQRRLEAPLQLGLLHLADLDLGHAGHRLGFPRSQQVVEHLKRQVPSGQVVFVSVDHPQQAAVTRLAAFDAARAVGDHLAGVGQDRLHSVRLGQPGQVAGAAGHRVEQHQIPAPPLPGRVGRIGQRHLQVAGVATEVGPQPQQ